MSRNIALNLWCADTYGDGSSGGGYKLTAYLLHKDGAVNSSVWVSVDLDQKDVGKDYVVDDEWFYHGGPSFIKMMRLFISKQVEEVK
jgi:hypothetical protein